MVVVHTKSDTWTYMLFLKRDWMHASWQLFLLYRYIADPRKKIPIALTPPFLRPDLSNRHVSVKVTDNGIHSSILRSQVSPQKLLIPSAHNLEFQWRLIISEIVLSTVTPAIQNPINTGSLFRFQWKLKLLNEMFLKERF